MIHLYHGDGKGKTTAAVGAAVRAAGSGTRALFVQFLKDGSSSEIGVLSSIQGIRVTLPGLFFGWTKNLTAEQKDQLRECYTSLTREIAASASGYGMIVFDEAVSVYRHGLFDKAEFLAFLESEKDSREIILTGRDPAPELAELADYITQMKKEKHPFDRGAPARRGVEF